MSEKMVAGLKKWVENIDKQIEQNKGKNLFYESADTSFHFINETINCIEKIGNITEQQENILLDYATDKVLEEFCRVNQYYSFDKEAKLALRNLYAELFDRIKKRSDSTDEISDAHYKNLKEWLQKTNPFAEKIYRDKENRIEPVACSEYSAALQMEIFHIDISQIMEPVLDIGCGRKGNLVAYLRTKKMEVYGIDRFAEENPFITKADWLEYQFGTSKWGTIISNLGFSNHFFHHHLRDDGNFLEYAAKYTEILHSLKTGGCFYYAPALSFIEKYLDKNTFSIQNQNIRPYNFETTAIFRLK